MPCWAARRSWRTAPDAEPPEHRRDPRLLPQVLRSGSRLIGYGLSWYEVTDRWKVRDMDSETYRQIVDGASEAIVVADVPGTIRYWNAGAEAMFGHRSAEAVGQSLDLIIPETQRARHWDGYRRVMETGTTMYARTLLAVPALHRDGRRLSIEFHVVLLRAPGGALSGIAAVIRDVTERWQEDRALRRRLHELEAEIDRLRQAGGPASSP